MAEKTRFPTPVVPENIILDSQDRLIETNSPPGFDGAFVYSMGRFSILFLVSLTTSIIVEYVLWQGQAVPPGFAVAALTSADILIRGLNRPGRLRVKPGMIH